MKKILSLLLILLLCGCYNYKELNKIAIVSSIAIDKKDNKYLVSAQIMNAKSENNTESSKIIVYSEKGKTINEALRNMTKKSPRMLYGGHIGKLVISEEIAKEGIINVIDIFQRLTEIKDEFTITIAKGIDASKVIKIMTNPDDVTVEYVKYTIENADIESALTYSSKLDEFVSFYLRDDIDPVISVIEVKNYNENSNTLKNTNTSSPETKIILDNIAITYNGKLEDFLNESETIGYNFIRNKINQMIIPIKCDNNFYSSISVSKSKTKTSVKRKKKKYSIIFDINTTGVITEYNCKCDLTNEKTINELQNLTERKIKKYINSVLKKQENTKSKFLGLKRIIYLDYPDYKKDDFDIKTNVHVNLSRKGEIRNSSKGAKYEYKNK